MSEGFDSRTSATLLGRLRSWPYDQHAWTDFVVGYGPRVHRWCMRRGLSETDARDATQEVFQRLLQAMRNFQYDPNGRFRAYLYAVVCNACRDLGKQQSRAGNVGSRQVQELLQAVEARDELCEQLSDEYLAELRREVLGRLRLDCPPREWEAWRQREEEGLSSQAIAESMGVATATIDGYISRVRSRIEALTKELDPRQ